jgi:hypothetical protein
VGSMAMPRELGMKAGEEPERCRYLMETSSDSVIKVVQNSSLRKEGHSDTPSCRRGLYVRGSKDVD